MTKAYWINTFTAVHDDAKLKEYIRLAGPVIQEAGGRFRPAATSCTPPRAAPADARR